MAGNSGLRMPPVSARPSSRSRKRGTMCRASPIVGVSFSRGAQAARDSQRRNIASDAAKVTPSATTRAVG